MRRGLLFGVHVAADAAHAVPAHHSSRVRLVLVVAACFGHPPDPVDGAFRRTMLTAKRFDKASPTTPLSRDVLCQ